MATKKQEMVINILNRRNYYRSLLGDKPMEITPYQVSSEARKNSVADLEAQAEDLEKWIKKAEVLQASKKYWEEHTEEKEQLEAKKAELGASYKAVQERYLGIFNKMIEHLNMVVTHMSTTNLEIASKLNPRYHFDVYYHNTWHDEPRELELNYPCYGSFNPLKDREVSDYLMSMAVFAYNHGLQMDLKDALNKFNKEMDDIREAVNEIDNYIKNPIKL